MVAAYSVRKKLAARDTLTGWKFEAYLEVSTGNVLPIRNTSIWAFGPAMFMKFRVYIYGYAF